MRFDASPKMTKTVKELDLKEVEIYLFQEVNRGSKLPFVKYICKQVSLFVWIVLYPQK